MGFFDLFRPNKEKLLKWQKTVIENSPDKLICTEKQLQDITNKQVKNDIRIIEDCVRILSETRNEKTFDSRLTLMDDTAHHLIRLEPYAKFNGVTPAEILKTLQKDKEDLIAKFNMRRSNPAERAYFNSLEKINVEWSVLSNLKVFDGEQADKFEEHCRKNIEQFKDYSAIEEKRGANCPHHVPAYVRLAMLYEKQKRYLDGIDVCAEAIRAGAYEDRTQGKMYGRLARLIKKSGIDAPDDIAQLAIQNNIEMQGVGEIA